VKIINIQTLSINEYILFGSLILVFLIQVYYVLRYYLKLARYRDTAESVKQLPVSIIIPVRNAENRIREFIMKFNELEHEDFQLVIIDVNSEDNTHDFLNELAETNPRLKVTSLNQETRFSEKQVINIGLKGAAAPWVILIDTHSKTISPEWLSGLAGRIDPETDAVIAYSNVERTKGFRNLLCRIERFNQFMVSGGRILAGKPFVFNQTNILFKKSLYFDTPGFRQKLNRNFANLELIFNENFKKTKVKLTTNPNLIVRELIEDDRGDHIKLLKKGVQIRQSLRWGNKISLFIEDLTRILIPVLVTGLIILLPEYYLSILVIPVIYLILLAVCVKMLLNRLNEPKIFLYSLVYILIKPIINWWFVWMMHLIYRRNKWN